VGLAAALAPSPAPASPPTGGGHCCGLDDALDARRVAERLGIPFYVMDLREAFKRAVMDDLAEAYAAGRTPNPCVQCNGVLKFDVLMKRCQLLGADLLATGHYARTDGTRLHVARDPAKDQSYFLWPLRSEARARTMFPLGDMTKAEVRAHAARLGLVTAQKAESMEVCFLPDDDHARFVREARPDLEGAGDIVDEAGRVLGRHDGYFRFTVGQRRGLGVATGAPVYVLRVEPDSRRVVVGPEARLMAHAATLDGCRWLRNPVEGGAYTVRVRHRGACVPCTVEVLEGGVARLRLRAPARAVTPGQSAVVYDGDEVVGGGYVRAASLEAPS
jgi:tRNA-specific 2-thiouridylase